MIGAIWSLVNRNWSSSLLKTCSYEAMTIETCNSKEKNSGEKGRVRKKIALQLLMKLFFSILKGGKIFECQFLLVLCVDAANNIQFDETSIRLWMLYPIQDYSYLLTARFSSFSSI
jgi:hypothetical protein